MEGSESEGVFESLNLNPQLFINEVLNTLDDLVDDAFHCYFQQASTALRIDGTDRSQDLKKGVAVIQNMIESVLSKRVCMWEEYCFKHCFEVPEGLTLPKNDEPSNNGSACQDAFHDPELDAELNSLRSKLTLVVEDSAVLNRELLALEQQSVASDRCAVLITEALKSYDKNSFDMMFEDMESAVSELRMKMGKLKKRKTEDTEHTRTERPHSLHGDSASLDYRKGFADANLEDLQGLLAEMKKI